MCNFFIKKGFTLDIVQQCDMVLDTLTNNVKKPISTILKTYYYGSLGFFCPIFEEYIFRDKLFCWIEKHQINPSSIISRIFKIVITGVLFGVIHCSLFQGWYNIPILITISLGGIILGILREYKQNIISSTTYHITNNTIAILEKGF